MLREQTAFGQSLAYQPVAQDSLAYGSALPEYEQRQLPDYYSAALAQRAAGTASNGRAAQADPAGEPVVPVAHFAGGPLYVAQGDWFAAAQPPAMVVNGHALAQAEGLHEATLPDLLAAGAVAGNWAPIQADPQPDHGCQTGGPCACGGACGGKCGGKCGSKGATSAGGCGCGKQGSAAHGVSAGNPWPIDDPRHNLVLLAQELLLLEGHLADPERQCPSCVTKHALTVRGLADEGRRLDAGQTLANVWAAASGIGPSSRSQQARSVRQLVVQAVVAADAGHGAHGGRRGPPGTRNPPPRGLPPYSSDSATLADLGHPELAPGLHAHQPAYCLPNCAGKACGSDGCNGSCGTCTLPKVCQNGTCGCAQQVGAPCGPGCGCGNKPGVACFNGKCTSFFGGSGANGGGGLPGDGSGGSGGGNGGSGADDGSNGGTDGQSGGVDPCDLTNPSGFSSGYRSCAGSCGCPPGAACGTRYCMIFNGSDHTVGAPWHWQSVPKDQIAAFDENGDFVHGDVNGSCVCGCGSYDPDDMCFPG